MGEIFIQVNDAFVRIGECHDVQIVCDRISEPFGLLAGAFETFTRTIELSAESAAALAKLFRRIDSRRLLRRRAVAKARGKNWRHVR